MTKQAEKEPRQFWPLTSSQQTLKLMPAWVEWAKKHAPQRLELWRGYK